MARVLRSRSLLQQDAAKSSARSKRRSPSLVCSVMRIPLMSTYVNSKGLNPQKKSIWQTCVFLTYTHARSHTLRRCRAWLLRTERCARLSAAHSQDGDTASLTPPAGMCAWVGVSARVRVCGWGRRGLVGPVHEKLLQLSKETF